MKSARSPALYDPRKGGEAIRLHGWSLEDPFEPPRTNCFTLALVESGGGCFWADAMRFQYAAGDLLCFVPYQHIRFAPESATQLEVIQFHANFLCVETFHAEVGCSGLLFNDPQGVPAVSLDNAACGQVQHLLERLRCEQTDRGLAYEEAMLSQLKVLLIVASRQKATQSMSGSRSLADPRRPEVLHLRELIEQHYRTLHSPAEYARLMHITPKSLGRIVREALGTTPSELIRGRILTHAKWQLLHTLRPVKEIAREVGFADELYFSRLFKKATGQSPRFFREFETEIRGGSNLSMFSAAAPIPEPPSASDPSVRSGITSD